MGVERVSDVDDPRLADYRDLKDGARRRRDGTFIAESRQVVRRLLGGSRLPPRPVPAPPAAGAGPRRALTPRRPPHRAPRAPLHRVVWFKNPPRCPARAGRAARAW